MESRRTRRPMLTAEEKLERRREQDRRRHAERRARERREQTQARTDVERLRCFQARASETVEEIYIHLHTIQLACMSCNYLILASLPASCFGPLSGDWNLLRSLTSKVLLLWPNYCNCWWSPLFWAKLLAGRDFVLDLWSEPTLVSSLWYIASVFARSCSRHYRPISHFCTATWPGGSPTFPTLYPTCPYPILIFFQNMPRSMPRRRRPLTSRGEVARRRNIADDRRRRYVDILVPFNTETKISLELIAVITRMVRLCST